MHQGWKALTSQCSLLYERMSMFRRMDAQTLVKLISAAGRLTVEWCKSFGIGVAKFQKRGEANIQLSQKYQVELAVIPGAFHWLHNQCREFSL